MKTPILTALTCCIVWSLGACTTNTFTTSPTATTRDWTTKDVANLMVTLVDPERIEWMMFHSDGSVPITLGIKSVSMSSPIYYWRIVAGRLRITDYDRKTYDELTLVSRTAKTIVARRRDGQLATYHILQQ